MRIRKLNKNHLLSYGVSYAREEGSGSRLKSSPNTSTDVHRSLGLR